MADDVTSRRSRGPTRSIGSRSVREPVRLVVGAFRPDIEIVPPALRVETPRGPTGGREAGSRPDQAAVAQTANTVNDHVDPVPTISRAVAR